MIFFRRTNGFTDGGAGGGEILVYADNIRTMSDSELVEHVRGFLLANDAIGDLAFGEIQPGLGLAEAVAEAQRIQGRRTWLQRRRSEFTNNRERLKAQLIERDGAECRHCGATGALTVDHIVPISRDGTDDLDNLQLLCQSCNSRKGARVQ